MRVNTRVRSDKGTEFLLRRLRRCDQGWERGMAHPGYRDEPTDEHAFTDEEQRRMYWVQSWRFAFHDFEQALYDQEDVRRGMIEGLSTREVATVYEND